MKLEPTPTLLDGTSPRPWREASGWEGDADCPVILDAAGAEVLGSSEWARMSREDLRLILTAVNGFGPES